MRRKLLIAAGVLAGAFVLIQAVPYGRSHHNPPVSQEPVWDSAATRQLAKQACFDCHSNETNWRWYTNVAPVSWLTQRDVNGGRSSLNFSEWNKPQDGAGDAVEAARSGSMPPWFYPLMHPNASLNASERLQLANGLAATFRRSPPIAGGG
jgi:mono/diheme cytochrome c family protein